MKKQNARQASLPFILLILSCLSVHTSGQESQKMNWTDTTYPGYVRKVTEFGERADWSNDGKKILFIEKSFGDVYEYNLETGKYKPLTHHYYHAGYTRALYLSNGDILLSGPKDFPGTDWEEARFRLCELWVLDRKLDKPAVRLGEYCWEGPAVSRTRLRIAWAQLHGLFPADARYYEIWMGDLDYSTGGQPRIINQRVVLNNSAGIVKDKVLEPQNFIPGREDELTVQAYPECEVLGLNCVTGKLVNYSNAPGVYDEPEGIFPDGQYTLVECSRHNKGNSGANIDLWKLKLDPANPSWERLTFFNETGVFKASNPVVSDDGRYIAFQVARPGEVAGIGHGIYILDLHPDKSGPK